MGIVQTLIEISIYATVIFLVILLLRWMLNKKLSPALCYMLWFVLIARLVLPVTLESTLNPIDAWRNKADTTAAVFSANETAIAANIPGDGESLMTDVPTASEAIQPEQPDTQAGRMPLLYSVLPIIWISGVVVTGTWIALSYARFRRMIKHGAEQPSMALAAQLDRVKTELGISSKIRVICQPTYGAPAIVFPATLWIPLGAIAGMGEAQVEDALRHELTHMKRLDPLVAALLTLLCAIYWFHPLVWVAAYLMREDMEAACDAQLTRTYSQEQKRRYAALLVDLYAQPALGIPALGFSGQGAHKQAERRVYRIFSAAKSKKTAVAVVVLGIVLLLFGCFTTACKPALPIQEQPQTATNPWPLAVPIESIGHDDARRTRVSKCATFAVDAEIIRPVDAAPCVMSLTKRTMTEQEIRDRLATVIPGEISDALQIVTEQNGVCVAIGTQYEAGKYTQQTYNGNPMILTESEQINGGYVGQLSQSMLYQPISLTLENAKIQANMTLDALGETGLMLQRSERACTGNFNEEGKMTLTSNGWCFTYVSMIGNLPTYSIDGILYSDLLRNERYYADAYLARIRIYVDESGVRAIDCGSLFDVDSVQESSPHIISYQKAIELAKRRLTQMFDDESVTWPWAFPSTVNLTVERVNLISAVVVKEPVIGLEGAYQASGEWRIIPVWQVIVSVADDDAKSSNAIEMRYSALDGVPLGMRF